MHLFFLLFFSILQAGNTDPEIELSTEGCWEIDTGYVGNDIRHKSVEGIRDASGCQETCSKWEGGRNCTHWTFIPTTENCWIKHSGRDINRRVTNESAKGKISGTFNSRDCRIKPEVALDLCMDKCHSNGTCATSTGKCTCDAGHKGDRCQEKESEDDDQSEDDDRVHLCKDKTIECKQWAKEKRCHDLNWKSQMMQHCRRSCNFCPESYHPKVSVSQCFSEDTLYAGNNIAIISKVSNANDCQFLCQWNTECRMWTYNPDEQMCWLKETHITNPTQSKGRISGPKHCESCEDKYDPVCVNGQIYENPCVARNAGFNKFKRGKCTSGENKYLSHATRTHDGCNWMSISTLSTVLLFFVA